MPRWFSQRPWFAALLVALALTAGHAISVIRQVQTVSAIPGEMVGAAPADATSPTGYDLGRRTLILPDTAEDGYQWIMQTQLMLAQSSWRLRHVDYDNAPTGRDVHWAAPLRWWLAALARLDHHWSGHPPGAAVEWAALRANPLLHVLLLVGLIPLTARRFGSAAAVVLALGLATAFPFHVYFGADYPDHHGISQACGMLTVLFLLVGGGGLVRTTEAKPARANEREAAAWLSTPRAARRWFVASAVAGGVGLWVSAVNQVPLLLGLGLGAVWSAWLRGPAPGDGWRRDPALWRLWGGVGAATSLAAYLVEYFPSHLGFRLEVNHPFYALAWLGGGELLGRIARLREPQGCEPTRRDVVTALAAALALALVPAVILLTGERTFLVADRFVWLLNTQFVAEAQSLPRYFAQLGPGWPALTVAMPLLLVVPPLALLGWRNGNPLWKMQAALALAPALLFLPLTLGAIRWWGLELALLLAALPPVFAALAHGNGPRRPLRWLTAGCGLALLPGAVALVQASIQPPGPTPADVRRLVERDVAHWLRQRAGTDRLVVASTPTFTNHLIYHAGGAGLGTLYWENTEGFKRAAAIFAASTAEEAHELVRRFGVTHLVLASWDGFPEQFVRFYRNLPPEQELPADTFVRSLLDGGVPRWLRPIPCRLPATEELQEHAVLVYEVTPQQSPAEAVAGLANYLIEMGEAGTAVGLARQLEEHSSDLRAQVALATCQAQAGHMDAFAATLERVRSLLPRAAELGAEDRLRLAVVLTVGREPELARAQLQQAVARLDERAIRRLTAGGLHDLLQLTQSLGVGFSDARLQQLAQGLYPPMLRPES